MKKAMTMSLMVEYSRFVVAHRENAKEFDGEDAQRGHRQGKGIKGILVLRHYSPSQEPVSFVSRKVQCFPCIKEYRFHSEKEDWQPNVFYVGRED